MFYKKNVCFYFVYIIGIMFCIYSCKRNTTMGMYRLGGGSSDSSSSFEITLGDLLSMDSDTSSSVETGPKGVVLFLHGLMADYDELSSISKYFRKRFGHSVLVIEPTCRVGHKSLRHSIERQAEDVFDVVKKSLQACNKLPANMPIIIIGYSQGGVIGLTLARNYADKLNICGIVTINSPIMGVPVLNCRTQDVREFIAQGKEGLKLIRESVISQYQQAQVRFRFPKGIKHVKSNLMLSSYLLRFVRSSFGGLRGICPNSREVCNVQEFLYQGHKNIPCLLIGTYQDDVNKLFTRAHEYNDSRVMEDFNIAYNRLITGREDGKHDTLISLSSQLCRGESFNDLTVNGDEMLTYHKLPGVQCQIYKGMVHSENLVAIDGDLFVMNESVHGVTRANRIIKEVFVFSRENLGLD